ncbi:MAG: LysR family transcriptional regulator, partial [Mycobacterium sp.]
MTKPAVSICKTAHVAPIPERPSPDDLLVLLAVGRTGRYTTAAEELGLNHTTISRRIAALERAMGGRVLARV